MYSFSTNDGIQRLILLDGLYQIASSEGISGLWAGTLPSLVLVSNPAIKFTAYEYLKRKVIEWNAFNPLKAVEGQLDAGQAFFLGVMASFVATVVTYPIQVVQTKSRVCFFLLFNVF